MIKKYPFAKDPSGNTIDLEGASHLNPTNHPLFPIVMDPIDPMVGTLSLVFLILPSTQSSPSGIIFLCTAASPYQW
jgi:hypothetical protein